MLSTDPGDGPGRPLPRDEPPVPGGGAAGDPDRAAGTPAPPLRDIVPPAAMANGGTILRPGAVAWGGTREAGPGGYPPGRRFASCEAIERALAAVVADPAQLPGLLTELAGTRLWVPLPDRRRPFTDGAAVRLPLVGYQGTEFVPCFTSVQRLSAWASPAGARLRGVGAGRDRRLDRPQHPPLLRPRLAGPRLSASRFLLLSGPVFSPARNALTRGPSRVPPARSRAIAPTRDPAAAGGVPR